MLADDETGAFGGFIDGTPLLHPVHPQLPDLLAMLMICFDLVHMPEWAEADTKTNTLKNC